MTMDLRQNRAELHFKSADDDELAHSVADGLLFLSDCVNWHLLKSLIDT